MEGLVARESELQAIRHLLAGERAVRALVLEGEPGVGKTTLWEQGVAWARERGIRVLVARSSEAETPLPFAGLIDLLDGVDTDELTGVPTPQLRALDVALYRADPTDRPPEPQVISIAVFSALRALAESGRLLVAVDDVQWLDRASEDALAYAARRLEHVPVAQLVGPAPGAALGAGERVPRPAGRAAHRRRDQSRSQPAAAGRTARAAAAPPPVAADLRHHDGQPALRARDGPHAAGTRPRQPR